MPWLKLLFFDLDLLFPKARRAAQIPDREKDSGCRAHCK
jgi:hypothetical protein